MTPLSIPEARAILAADEALDATFLAREASGMTLGSEEAEAWIKLVARECVHCCRRGCSEDCVSRPHVTDDVVDGLGFARACVLDQRVASHNRKDYSWDKRYVAALDAIDAIVAAHKRAVKNATKAAKARKTS